MKLKGDCFCNFTYCPNNGPCPCKTCLVRPVCRNMCDERYNMFKLDEEESEHWVGSLLRASISAVKIMEIMEDK